MNKYLNIFSILLLYCFLQADGKKTWLSPDPLTQIRREAKDDQMGHGRIFVPALSYSDWEPRYKIYTSDEQLISNLKTGESYFLKPGKYKVVLGSAVESIDQIQKEITIKEQETVILEPEWSGLIVKAIDENREGVRMGYELFNQTTGISIGVKYSKADNEYDDRQDTWLLLPGKYKFVKYGEPYNTLVNFTTFELKAGELLKMTVVKDSKTAFIIGSGELPDEQFGFAAGKDWRNYLYLRGQFSYSGNNDVSQNDHESIFDFRGKIDNHVKYDKLPYYLSLRQYLENGISKNNSDDVKISTDELQLDNTGIYYFTKIIGVYADFSISAKIFPSTIYFDQPQTISVYNSSGTEIIETLNMQKEFQLAPSIYPLTTGEEIGLNFSFIKTSDANFYLRTGIGFIQKQNTDVYNKTSETDSTVSFSSVSNEFVKGYVIASGLDWQLPGNITYTAEANMIYSLDKKDDYQIRCDNNLKFKFLKYVSLDYTLNLNYNSTQKYINYNNRMSLEFSYYLNY